MLESDPSHTGDTSEVIAGLRAVTWKMESADLTTGCVVTVMLFSTDSHSWMVTMLRAGGGMWRCVSRAFFRW